MEKCALIQQVVDRVANCYAKHGLCCSESVMVVINRVFHGGLDDRAALQMGAGFCHGIGGAGCSCGALTGSVAMLSTFLGHHQKNGLAKKKFQSVVKCLHDDFRQKFGSTCCRILSKKLKHDKKAHQENCLMLTRGGAEMGVALLLELRPELTDGIDELFLKDRAYPLSS
jgi:C_GCAxxG_C_C family probable redox protein